MNNVTLTQPAANIAEQLLNNNNPEPMNHRPCHGVKRVNNYAETGFESHDDDSDYNPAIKKSMTLDNKHHPSKLRLRSHNHMASKPKKTNGSKNKNKNKSIESDDTTDVKINNNKEPDTEITENKTVTVTEPTKQTTKGGLQIKTVALKK